MKREMDKAKFLEWLDGEDAAVLWEGPDGLMKYDMLVETINSGEFDPDTPPVPTIKPGDKDTANLIADLLFAFINQDAYYPHDFEIKAFEDAITVLRPHFEHINYHPKLFVDHLERMRRSYQG